MEEFCKSFLDTAAQLAFLAEVFLLAALAAGTICTIVEIDKRSKAPVTDGNTAVRSLVTGQEIKGVLDALRELVAALVTVPGWLALMTVGLLTFWVVGNSLPDECATREIKPPAAVKKDVLPGPAMPAITVTLPGAPANTSTATAIPPNPATAPSAAASRPGQR